MRCLALAQHQHMQRCRIPLSRRGASQPQQLACSQDSASQPAGLLCSARLRPRVPARPCSQHRRALSIDSQMRNRPVAAQTGAWLERLQAGQRAGDLRVAASPVYVSRSERQSMSVSQGGVVSQRVPHVPPSLTASPAISEMVYSLSGTPMSQSWLADRGPSGRGGAFARAPAGSTNFADGAPPDAMPARVRAQLPHAAADEAGLAGRQGSSEAAIAASAGGEPPGSLPAGQDDRSSGHEQDPEAQAQHAQGVRLRVADAAVPSFKTPDMSYAWREMDEQPIEGAGRARWAAECQQIPHPPAQSVSQPEVGSRRQTDSSYVSCEGGQHQGDAEGTPLDYSGFSSDMRAHANATAESLFRQAEASTAGKSSEQSNHPDSGRIQQGAAWTGVGFTEP